MSSFVITCFTTLVKVFFRVKMLNQVLSFLISLQLNQVISLLNSIKLVNVKGFVGLLYLTHNAIHTSHDISWHISLYTP